MAQEQFAFGGVKCVAPDVCNAVLATTSTEDSDRDMALNMRNTPIGTVHGYDLTWGRLTASQTVTILQQVLNKPKFLFRYFDITRGVWRDDYFYASNFSAPAFSLEDGFEAWDGLAINVRSTNPL